MMSLATLMTATQWAIFAPLAGSLLAGLACRLWSRVAAYLFTISGVVVAWLAALVMAKAVLVDGLALNQNLYTWVVAGSQVFALGWWVDSLTAIMALLVTSISLLVHIYSVGYMADDDGYARFFSYVSFFTFAMMTLICANNLLVIFFGWEGVGVASYLLIGFWFHKDSACVGSFKAFLVNRVGDFGFLMGIAWLLIVTGSLDYATVFANLDQLIGREVHLLGWTLPLADWVAFCLFVGAMGKSAQIPLHVWLPESMEGPTPISALIHAATMVTAGIFMMTRLSPLFVMAPHTQNLIMMIGASGAFFLGLIGLVQHDIKRVVAYSTLSQLGYMIAACGASMYHIAMFHLVTHAFFKALLFLGAGSVIVAMHHEQDMRQMGGLARSMPITYLTFLIGSLSLVALPGLSGFYSKDAIIEALSLSAGGAAHYAHVLCLLGAAVTALYSARALMMTFHGRQRSDHAKHAHEPGLSITVPLIILAVPSVVLGFWLAPFMLSVGEHNWLSGVVAPSVWHSHIAVEIAAMADYPWIMAKEALTGTPFYLATSGLLVGAWIYAGHESLAAGLAKRFAVVYRVLTAKYGFDAFNARCIVKPALWLADKLYHVADMTWIDRWLVNGAAHWTSVFAQRAKLLQSGYLFQYATVMVAGLAFILGFMVYIR